MRTGLKSLAGRIRPPGLGLPTPGLIDEEAMERLHELDLKLFLSLAGCNANSSPAFVQSSLVTQLSDSLLPPSRLTTGVLSPPPQQRRARRGSAPSRTSSSSGRWIGWPGARAGSPRRTPPSDAPRAATASACGRKARRAKCGSSNKVTSWKHARR